MSGELSAGWHVVYASQIGATLDSNVHAGGKTDDTAALQAALDRAPARGSLRLLMDGAARVRGLDVHSNQPAPRLMARVLALRMAERRLRA